MFFKVNTVNVSTVGLLKARAAGIIEANDHLIIGQKYKSSQLSQNKIYPPRDSDYYVDRTQRKHFNSIVCRIEFM